MVENAANPAAPITPAFTPAENEKLITLTKIENQGKLI